MVFALLNIGKISQKKKAFNVMQKIYNNYDFIYVFAFEKVCSEAELTFRHL